MKIGFDLDGCLDRERVLWLAKELWHRGHEIHVISGIFTESGTWQSEDSKKAKVMKLWTALSGWPSMVTLHVINSSPGIPREDRLVDIGLQKGALCQRLGIAMMFDDSDTYTKVMKAMAGDLIVCHVK